MTEVIEDQAIANFSQTEAALTALTNRYQDVAFDVTTTAGMKDAKAARMDLRSLRTGLERARTEKKAYYLDVGRRIDKEAERITDHILDLERPIDALIKAEEKKKDDEKAAKVAAEQARLDATQAKINEIRALVQHAYGCPAARIEQFLADAHALDVESFDEDARQGAAAEKSHAILSLQTLLNERRKLDTEAEQNRKNAEEVERLRALLAVAQQEREALAAREREERLALERREREAREAEEARVRAEREAAEAAERKRAAAEAREREDARLREEQARQAQEKATRERLEAEATDAQRRADEAEIAAATLAVAALEAVNLLCKIGYGEHKTTKKLITALHKEGFSVQLPSGV